MLSVLPAAAQQAAGGAAPAGTPPPEDTDRTGDAADGGTAAAPAPPERASRAPRLGPVTNLPMPRFVSLKAREGNVRRGPSLSHRIDWVFTRKDMPLQITAEYGHWRRVQDRDGVGGWVHYSLLSGVRTVLIEADQAPMLDRPEPDAAITAIAERGVVARLEECLPDWCRLEAGGYDGWVRRDAFWGIGANELPE
ncbi:SH3 domain-containing protein [Profundibacterium mesophilum]